MYFEHVIVLQFTSLLADNGFCLCRLNLLLFPLCHICVYLKVV